MTEIKPLKVGEKLEPKPGTTDADIYANLELAAVSTVDGNEYWWASAQYRDAEDTTKTIMITMPIDHLRERWVRVPSFFAIGRTYKHVNGTSDKYTIMETYTLESPIDSSWSAFAVAKVSDHMSGRNYGTTLNAFDFTYMEEVR